MSCDFIALANSGIQGLTPYQPGKPIAELERELGITGSIKMASNENPLGPSPNVLETVSSTAPTLARYPDANAFRLKAALSEHLNVSPDSLSIGNGSNEVLDLLARAYLNPESESVFSEYAFVVYPISTQATGAKAVVTPAHQWGHDLKAMAAAITDRTRLVFIANPNNPTGTWLSSQAIEAFLAKVPENVLVVVDEAYYEYVDENDYATALPLMARFPNLIVTRTFSKAYGLAGLRVGYSVSHPDIANVLNRARNPFNVNSVALAAAETALADTGFLAESVALNKAGLQQLQEGVEALNLDYIPSVANFLTVNFGRDAMPVYDALLREGVIVRPLGGYQMPESLRVTIGLASENERFLETLAKVLGL